MVHNNKSQEKAADKVPARKTNFCAKLKDIALAPIKNTISKYTCGLSKVTPKVNNKVFFKDSFLGVWTCFF